MIEPGTNPPPSTRSTSPMPDGRREASALVMVPIGDTAEAPAIWRAADGARPDLGAAIVSTRVFQALQAGHCPAHFGDAAPHCWHR
jgi:hypothetical protein